MKNITLHFKDNSVQSFKHVGRAGGSYSKSIRYENGFVVIVDEYQNETVFPSDSISKIDIENLSGRW